MRMPPLFRAIRHHRFAALFNALRKWRREEAQEQEIPPYVIFHDSVLRDIAMEKPQDLDMLGDIKGVGRSKLERYGEAVLDVLAMHGL